jgi:hypothetical protein
MSLFHAGLNKLPEQKVDKELVKLDIIHEHNLQDRRLELEIEERKWRSCCFQLESESTKFFGKMAISLITIAVCSYQLIMVKECSYQIGYSSLLGMVVGSYLKV